jgi:hypothetical protein
MATPRKPDLIPCDAPLPDGGRCTRMTVPGASCGFHPAPPIRMTPRRAKACRCTRPIAWTDELGRRCVRCGKWLDLPESAPKRGPETPPNAMSGPGPSDRSRDPVRGTQLQLAVDARPARKEVDGAPAGRASLSTHTERTR